MSDQSGQNEAGRTTHYKLTITVEEARKGSKKILSRNNKRLEVTIPPGIQTGNTIKLINALQLTDNQPGDILIQIEVKSEEAADAGVLEVSDTTFEKEVLKANLPVVVDFWAPWCDPCKMMAPVMESLANQFQGKFKFCKINADQNPLAASKFQAMSIPMLLFFRNGEVIDQSVGAVPEAQLKTKLESLLQQQT